jgi:hypothetical protein
LSHKCIQIWLSLQQTKKANKTKTCQKQQAEKKTRVLTAGKIEKDLPAMYDPHTVFLEALTPTHDTINVKLDAIQKFTDVLHMQVLLITVTFNQLHPQHDLKLKPIKSGQGKPSWNMKHQLTIWLLPSRNSTNNSSTTRPNLQT